MTDVLTPARERNRSSGLYRAFWRWHFYASFLVIPVMLILSITGLIYMFRFTIDPLMHQGVITVQSEQGEIQPLSVQQEAVEQAFPDYPVLSATQPSGDRATLFTVADGEETVRSVYVDPYTAQVTGDLNPESLLSNMAVRLHGELMTGKIGDAVIELAVCWAIVMTITGYYLFVRNWRKRRTRAPIRRRHAMVGAIAGAGILFLIVSGLPWTGLWGEKVQEIAAPRGMSLWGEDPGATSTLKESIEDASSSSAPAGWAIGETEVPSSTGHNHGGGAATGEASGDVTIDTAVNAAYDAGVPGPYFVVYPDGEEGVFSVMGDQWNDPGNPAFRDVSKEAVAHVDQYSGEVVATYTYDEYTPVAKVVSQAISLHEGRKFGGLNTIATTAFCLGVIFLCITGPLMWWIRRPKGAGLSAPRGRMPLRTSPWLLVGLVALCLVRPLFGLSVVLLLLFDTFVVRRSARLRQWLAAE